jgi:iron only hydrogenase large subunit-like protein
MDTENFSSEAEKLLGMLERGTNMVAMLAPSFPVVFEYPQIIGMLKQMGFKRVVEVARGAEETNKQLLALMKLHPDRKYITNPCPTVVRTIRNKFPELVECLAPIDSPMVATAKICIKKWPRYKKVFIGPCMLKKLEAKEDHPDLDILAITFKDLQNIFSEKKIKPKFLDKFGDFDIKARDTRLYPISGGLAQSSGVISKLTDPQYDVISGPQLVEKTLRDFLKNPELKVLDILNCEGGCINGPGIISSDSLDRRRQKIINYWNKN